MAPDIRKRLPYLRPIEFGNIHESMRRGSIARNREAAAANQEIGRVGFGNLTYTLVKRHYVVLTLDIAFQRFFGYLVTVPHHVGAYDRRILEMLTRFDRHSVGYDRSVQMCISRNSDFVPNYRILHRRTLRDQAVLALTYDASIHHGELNVQVAGDR